VVAFELDQELASNQAVQATFTIPRKNGTAADGGSNSTTATGGGNATRRALLQVRRVYCRAFN
jgi:hypothetical protein